MDHMCGARLAGTHLSNQSLCEPSSGATAESPKEQCAGATGR